MRYAKLVGGVPLAAPKILKKEGRVHYHPPAEMYREAGYLPVIVMPYPESVEGEEEKLYVDVWREKDGVIVCEWVEVIDILDLK